MKILKSLVLWGWIAASACLVIYAIFTVSIAPEYCDQIAEGARGLIDFFSLGADRPLIKFENIASSASVDLIGAAAGFLGIAGGLLKTFDVLDRYCFSKKWRKVESKTEPISMRESSEAERFWANLKGWLVIAMFFFMSGWVVWSFYVLGNPVPVAAGRRMLGAIVAIDIAPFVLVSVTAACLLLAFGYQPRGQKP
jgi:hypothetical protein